VPAMDGQVGRYDDAVGFITSERAKIWHWNPDCPAFAPHVARNTVKAETVLTLSDWQATQRRYPCRTCAASVVLDYLGDYPAGAGGYHFIYCRGPHSGRRPCRRCAELTSYAATRTAPCARVNGRAWVLRVGAVHYSMNSLFGPGVGGWTTPWQDGPALPAMTAASWSAAATLIAAGALPCDALTAATALTAEPSST